MKNKLTYLIVILSLFILCICFGTTIKANEQDHIEIINEVTYVIYNYTNEDDNTKTSMLGINDELNIFILKLLENNVDIATVNGTIEEDATTNDTTYDKVYLLISLNETLFKVGINKTLYTFDIIDEETPPILEDEDDNLLPDTSNDELANDIIKILKDNGVLTDSFMETKLFSYIISFICGSGGTLLIFLSFIKKTKKVKDLLSNTDLSATSLTNKVQEALDTLENASKQLGLETDIFKELKKVVTNSMDDLIAAFNKKTEVLEKQYQDVMNSNNKILAILTIALTNNKDLCESGLVASIKEVLYNDDK